MSDVDNNITTSSVTLVTGLWNIKRDSLQEGWSRSYEHYLNKLEELLKVDNNLIIYGDESLKEFVDSRRSKHNTSFILRDLDWFINNEYYEKIQSIRNRPEWYGQVGWLAESTQAKLELYNPLVMSKVFLLNDACIMDSFNSTHLVWVDAGITNTVHPGYFTHDKVQNKFTNLFDKVSFICFPYQAETEIHGFNLDALNSYAGNKVSKVARGGIFGGPKGSIADFNNIYYNLLITTLNNGYMGTEESLFSVLLYRHPERFNHFMIEDNGLISKFCEDVKNNTTQKISHTERVILPLEETKVGLYVIGFNSPAQFEVLIESYLKHTGFVTKTRNFLINNSTDENTTAEYLRLCDKYNFTHIKKDNLGICGGRQFIAEHFDEQKDLNYYIFLEDDMNLMPQNDNVCISGFRRYVDALYEKSLTIINNEGYDFLKLCFSEFYGTNSTQWSWYNVPQHVRSKYFPEKTNLPVSGTDPDAPKVIFNNIKTYIDLPYADGDVYYCNWPQFVSRQGNEKMFLKTKWAHPYEQTWMSYIFQETKAGNIRGSVLLLSPVNHHRFAHYDGSLRKES